MESSCAQIEVFQLQDSRLLLCDPVRNKASVLLGLTHTVKLSHTPSGAHTQTGRETNAAKQSREELNERPSLNVASRVKTGFAQRCLVKSLAVKGRQRRELAGNYRRISTRRALQCA